MSPVSTSTVASLLLVALCAVPAGGQEPTEPRPARVRAEAPLTLVEAARRALAEHPSLGEARARVRAVEAEVDEARAARLPELGLSGSATRYQEPMVVTPIHGFTPGQTPPFDRTLVQGSARLAYTIWDGGARGSRIEASRSRTSATRARRSEAEQALLARVSAVYLEVLSLDGVLRAHDRLILALEAEMERVEELQSVGRAARVDRLRVEAELAGAEAGRVGVEADLRMAEADLARLIGAAPADVPARRLQQPTLRADTPPEADSLRVRAETTSPALRRARSEVEAAEEGVSVARSARWPRVELDGRLVHWGSDADPAAATEWNAGVQVSVPIFTGGAVGSRVTRARAESAAARERLRTTRLETAREVDQALSAHRQARARSRSLEARVLSLEEVARIEALRLETGTGTQSDYLDAEAALLQARADLTRARHAVLGARVQIARVEGALSLEWMDRTLGADR